MDKVADMSRREVVAYAVSLNLNPYKLFLFKDLFSIYEEGEHECVVFVQTITSPFGQRY